MKRLLILALVLALVAIPLAAQSPTERPAEEIGSQVLTPTVSTALTVPTGSQWAILSIRSKGIHVSFDGTAATTNDLYYPPGVYRTSADYRLLPLIRIIDSSDGASAVSVKYFRQR